MKIVRFMSINPEGRIILGPFVYPLVVAKIRLRQFKVKTRKGSKTALVSPNTWPKAALWEEGYTKLNTEELNCLIRVIEAQWLQQERRSEYEEDKDARMD